MVKASIPAHPGNKGRRSDARGLEARQADLRPGPDLVGRVWENWKTSMAFE